MKPSTPTPINGRCGPLNSCRAGTFRDTPDSTRTVNGLVVSSQSAKPPSQPTIGLATEKTGEVIKPAAKESNPPPPPDPDTLRVREGGKGSSSGTTWNCNNGSITGALEIPELLILFACRIITRDYG